MPTADGRAMVVIVALNIVVHGCFIGSRLVISLYALQHFNASPLEVGLMVSLYTIPPWLLGVVAGRIGDRYGARMPMLLGAGLVACGLVVPALWNTLPALYVLAMLVGTGFVFFNVNTQNLAGAVGPRERRAQNFSTLSLGYSLSSLCGPLAGGYALQYLEPRIAFLLFAASLTLPIAVLWAHRTLTQVAPIVVSEGRHSAFELLRMPELRRTLILGALVVTGWDLYLFYTPIYGNSVGMSSSLIGKLIAAFAVGTLVVRFMMPRLVKRFSVRYTLAASVACGALFFIALPLLQNPWLLGALSFVIGLALGCGQPLTLMLSYNRSPVGRTGEVTGIRLALNHGTHSAVPIAAGALGSAFGAWPPFLIIASILGFSAYLATQVTPMAPLKPPSG